MPDLRALALLGLIRSRMRELGYDLGWASDASIIRAAYRLLAGQLRL